MIPDYANPLELFSLWLEEAKNTAGIDEPTAMTLATVDEHGMPWARVVLLKGAVEGGFFSFYTNLESRKAEHLRHSPKAGLCFYWMPLYKQIRVQGAVEEVTAAEADAYFASRPRESQIGAWASDQSRPLEDRKKLVHRFEEATRRFEGEDVPRPPHWSGFRLKPTHMEFWLGLPHRLHDRVAYDRTARGDWTAVRVYP